MSSKLASAVIPNAFPRSAKNACGHDDTRRSIAGSSCHDTRAATDPPATRRSDSTMSPTATDIPGTLAFWYEINRELQVRTGGNPFDNRNTLYDGFDNDAAVNRGVKRYAADAKAREYLRQHYAPTGRIADPVLTMHTTYDPLIPGRYVSEYDAIVKVAGTQDLFVTKFVEAKGHCNFTPAQTGTAFDELLKWIREKKKPEAGEVK